jgi:hypothetical protein
MLPQFAEIYLAPIANDQFYDDNIGIWSLIGQEYVCHMSRSLVGSGHRFAPHLIASNLLNSINNNTVFEPSCSIRDGCQFLLARSLPH